MKKTTLQLCFVASVLSLTVACGSGSNNSNADTATMQNSDTGMSGNMNNTSSNNMSSSDTSKKDDRDFLMEAANGGMMEVELGKIAQANASSPKVKDFGKMMVTDHGKANEELKGIAAKMGITLPASAEGKMKDHIDDLRDKKGMDFDKDYVSMMIDDHKEDISKFEKEANEGKDAEIKAFAAKTLPVLRKHLEAVTAIKDGMK